MVWPFGRRDDNSPDSFERILAKLSTQIQAQSTKLDTLRTQGRRYKALWTLCTIIVWMLYMMVLILVVGREQLSVQGIVGAVGGPVAIYCVRWLLVFFYDRRIENAESTLANLTTERSETIEKLKTATKFYSTQSLLEKYGGGSEMTEGGMFSRKSSVAGLEGMNPQQSLRLRNVNGQQQGSVRGKLPQHLLPPGQQQQPHQPPQAPPQQPQQGPNIPPEASPPPENLSPSQAQIQEQLRQQRLLRPISGPGQPVPSGQPSPTHATFSIPPPPQVPSSAFPPTDYLEPEIVPASSGSRWYDRLLDVLIGEDETSAKARFALICSNCRMVNGLAPPGTKSMAEIGKWGCGRCGAMNGKDIPKIKKTKAVGADGDVAEIIEREIAEEMLTRSVKKGTGRSRGSIKGWTKQIQELQAQQEMEEAEGEEGEGNQGEEAKEISSSEEEEAPPVKPAKGKKGVKGKR